MVLSAQSFLYGKDFHQMFIADEGNLQDSLLFYNNEGDFKKSRRSSNASIRQDKVRITVDD